MTFILRDQIVYSLSHKQFLQGGSKHTTQVLITNVCKDCGECKQYELTNKYSNCQKQVHCSCAGKYWKY
jgi:hypothetical protein